MRGWLSAGLDCGVIEREPAARARHGSRGAGGRYCAIVGESKGSDGWARHRVGRGCRRAVKGQGFGGEQAGPATFVSDEKDLARAGCIALDDLAGQPAGSIPLNLAFKVVEPMAALSLLVGLLLEGEHPQAVPPRLGTGGRGRVSCADAVRRSREQDHPFASIGVYAEQLAIILLVSWLEVLRQRKVDGVELRWFLQDEPRSRGRPVPVSRRVKAVATVPDVDVDGGCGCCLRRERGGRRSGPVRAGRQGGVTTDPGVSWRSIERATLRVQTRKGAVPPPVRRGRETQWGSCS